MYEVDRHVRKEIRKAIQQPVRDVRDQVARPADPSRAHDPAEAAQLDILGDYALAIQTALNLDGQQPFRYASLAVDDALHDVAASLEELEKGGPSAGDAPPPNWPA